MKQLMLIDTKWNYTGFDWRHMRAITLWSTSTDWQACMV